jgi:hypothetical protein
MSTPKKMPCRVLILGVVMTLAGPLDTVCASDGSASRWARFNSAANRTTARLDSDTSAAAAPLAVATTDALPTVEVVESGAARLFRAGPSPQFHGAYHEPPPNYNFRDPNYYPDAGLGFPIRSSHGSWIGGRTGVRSWKHRGYHEDYHQGTIQWRW